jgi:hypothetical protein
MISSISAASEISPRFLRRTCSPLQARWASSDTTTFSEGTSPGALKGIMAKKGVDVLDKSGNLSLSGVRNCIRARSLTRAALTIFTKGLFPDRKTAVGCPSGLRIGSCTALSPASVLPARGTPVKKHVILRDPSRASVHGRHQALDRVGQVLRCRMRYLADLLAGETRSAASIILGLGR